jgi:hypothetical protein
MSCDACTEKDQLLAEQAAVIAGLKRDIQNGAAVIKMMEKGHKRALAVIERLEAENRKVMDEDRRITERIFEIVNKTGQRPRQILPFKT